MENVTEVQAILITFWLLQVKHFLADFVWQTNQMIADKGVYGAKHGIYHSLIHSAGTFVAFVWIHPVIGIATAIVDFIVHYHIDWAKININKKYNYTPQDSNFWFWLGLDQCAHQITYILLVGWIFLTF